MKTRTLTRYEIKAPTGLETRFGNFDNADWVWNGICWMGILYTTTGWGLFSLHAVAAIVFWVLGTYRLLNGRVYQLVLDGLANLWRLLVKKGIVWQHTSRRPYPRMPLSKIISIDEKDTNKSVVPIGNDGTLAVFILGSGWKHATDEAAAQRMHMEELAVRIRSLKGVGVSWLYLNRPLDLWPLRNFAAEALAPGVFMPRTFDDAGEEILEPDDSTLRDQTLHDLAKEQQRVTAKIGRDSTAVMVLLIPAKLAVNRQELAKNKTGEITKREYRKDPAMRIADKMVLALKKYGVSDAHVATTAETASIIRTSWDGEARTFYDLLHDRGNEVVKEALFLPQQHIVATRSHIKADGNYLGFIRMTAMPEVVTPLSFSKLYGIKNDEGKPISLAVTVLGTAVSARNESRWLDRLIPIREAFLSLFSGTYRSVESREARGENEQRKRELVASGYLRYDYIPFLTVNATSLEELEDNIQCVSEVMERLGLEPKQIHGAAQQMRAFKSVSGLCFM